MRQWFVFHKFTVDTDLTPPKFLLFYASNFCVMLTVGKTWPLCVFSTCGILNVCKVSMCEDKSSGCTERTPFLRGEGQSL